jgi:hypothetical protein
METIEYDKKIYDTIRKNIKKHRKAKKWVAIFPSKRCIKYLLLSELALMLTHNHEYLRA